MEDTEPTAEWLDHYVNQNVQIVRMAYSSNRPDLAFVAQKELIEGLENKMERGMIVSDGVTIEHVKEIIELARKEWTKDSVISLYKRYCEIRDRPFEEGGLFD